MSAPTEKSSAKYIRLEYSEGSSNKFYEINYTKNSTGVFEISTCHGRIGNNPQYQTKYKGKSFDEALRTWYKFYNQKIKKGYKVTISETGAKAKSKAKAQPAKVATALTKARSKAKKAKIKKELSKQRFGDLEL